MAIYGPQLEEKMPDPNAIKAMLTSKGSDDILRGDPRLKRTSRSSGNKGARHRRRSNRNANSALSDTAISFSTGDSTLPQLFKSYHNLAGNLQKQTINYEEYHVRARSYIAGPILGTFLAALELYLLFGVGKDGLDNHGLSSDEKFLVSLGVLGFIGLISSACCMIPRMIQSVENDVNTERRQEAENNQFRRFEEELTNLIHGLESLLEKTQTSVEQTILASKQQPINLRIMELEKTLQTLKDTPSREIFNASLGMTDSHKINVLKDCCANLEILLKAIKRAGASNNLSCGGKTHPNALSDSEPSNARQHIMGSTDSLYAGKNRYITHHPLPTVDGQEYFKERGDQLARVVEREIKGSDHRDSSKLSNV